MKVGRKHTVRKTKANDEKFKLPKLSQVPNRKKQFCYCPKCVLGYENDLDTQHAPCPKCDGIMYNMTEENVKKQISLREKERKDRYNRFKKEIA